MAKWAQEAAANEDDASSWGPDASGEWWTAPLGEGLVSTSRALGDLPATELALYDYYPPDSEELKARNLETLNRFLFRGLNSIFYKRWKVIEAQ